MRVSASTSLTCLHSSVLCWSTVTVFTASSPVGGLRWLWRPSGGGATGTSQSLSLSGVRRGTVSPQVGRRVVLAPPSRSLTRALLSSPEQHFLNQLEDLRLLSFTPSREVCGQRISSHDDRSSQLLLLGPWAELPTCPSLSDPPLSDPPRFLLHLAEKTDGVIVTNDNLRDFVDTSDTWRRIIQER